MEDNPIAPDSSWSPVTLSQCGELFCGQSASVQEVNSQGKGEPYFTGPEQWDGTKLHVDKWTEFPRRLVPDGCIFITVKGAGVGKLFPGLPGAIGRDIYAYKPHPKLDFRFIHYALQHTINAIVLHAKGDIPGLSKSHILDHQLLLPNLAQQKNVVNTLDELFSEIDKGVDALRLAKQQISIYRQTVLRHAFEGNQTSDWRRDRALPSPSDLLASIELERVSRANSSVGRSRVSQISRKSTNVDHEVGSEIAIPRGPSEWGTATIGNLNVDVFDGPFGSNLKTSDYTPEGVRVIRLENIGSGHFVDDKRSFVSEEKYQEIKKHTVVAGDIVFSSFVTDSIRSTIVPASVSFAINKADCFCIRLFGETVSSKYLQYFLESRNALKQVQGMIHGVGRPRINTSQLKAIAIPICSPEEQQLVVSEVERAISRADSVSADIESIFGEVAILRQAIMEQAFSGQLASEVAGVHGSIVPQRSGMESDNLSKKDKTKRNEEAA